MGTLMWLAHNSAKAAILDGRACLCTCALLLAFRAAAEVMQQFIMPKQHPFLAVYSIFGMLCLGVLVMTSGSVGNLSAICWLTEAWGVQSSAQGEA